MTKKNGTTKFLFLLQKKLAKSLGYNPSIGLQVRIFDSWPFFLSFVFTHFRCACTKCFKMVAPVSPQYDNYDIYDWLLYQFVHRFEAEYVPFWNTQRIFWSTSYFSSYWRLNASNSYIFSFHQKKYFYIRMHLNRLLSLCMRSLMLQRLYIDMELVFLLKVLG